MPSCVPGHGTLGDEKSCNTCPAGYYQHDEGYPWPCRECGLGTYSTAGSPACLTCPGEYSYPPVSKGATTCDGVCLCFYTWQLGFLLLLICGVYALCWWQAAEGRIAIAINMVLPMIDHTTDILYFVKTPFYSVALCLLSFACVMGPTTMFTYYLLKDEAIPPLIRKFDVLIVTQEKGAPLLYGKPLSISFAKHDTPVKFVWWVVLWIMLCFLQCGMFAVTAVYYMVYLACLSGWFLLGAFLFATRTIAVGKVRLFWYGVWTNDSNWFNDGVMGDIDTEVLNQCLFAGFVLETIPHFFIQVINNVLIGNWSIFTAISAASSLYMVFSGVWQFIYYRYWLDVPLHEVPVNCILPMNWKVMEFAKVRPAVGARHKKRGGDTKDNTAGSAHVVIANPLYAEGRERRSTAYSGVELMDRSGLVQKLEMVALCEKMYALVEDKENHSALTESFIEELGLVNAVGLLDLLEDEYDLIHLAGTMKRVAAKSFLRLLKELRLLVEKQPEK